MASYDVVIVGVEAEVARFRRDHPMKRALMLKLEGSCVAGCGSEARPGKTKCFDCARKNAAYAKACNRRRRS